MKRSYLIIIIVVVVVIAAVLLFMFFSKSQSPTTPVGTTGTLPQTGTQSVGNGSSTNNGTSGLGTNSNSGTLGAGGVGGATKFGVISNEPVLDYSVDAQNNITVVEPDGKIAAIVNGQANLLSSSEIQDLTSGSFSYDGKKILVSFGDPTNPQTSVFDLTTKAWTPLAAGITSPVWSPSDYRIAYLTMNSNGTESIVTLDVSKASAKPIVLLTLNIEGVSLGWPDKNQMVLEDKPSVYAPGSAWLFNLTTKALTPAALQATGLEAAWSNTTSSMGLLFESGMGGYGGSLSLFDSSSSATQALSFLTLPSKCSFSYESGATTSVAVAMATGTAGTSATTSAVAGTGTAPAPYLALYCAIPTTSAALSSAPEPDSYNELAVFTADDFYQIRTDTGAAENIFSPSQTVDATDLKIFNNVLYFVNRYDLKLYAISLSGE